MHECRMNSSRSVCRLGQTGIREHTDSNSMFSSVLWELVFCQDSRFDKKVWVNNWNSRQAALEPAAYQSFLNENTSVPAGRAKGQKILSQIWDAFAEYTEVKLCCFCSSIFILIRLVLSGCRWSNDMQGGDEQRFRKLVQYCSSSSILTKVSWALWCGRCWLIDLKS